MKVTLIKRKRFAAYNIAATILSALAFTVSCRKGMSHSSLGTRGPSQAAPNGVEVKTYHCIGVVERIDRKNNVIKINHEEIKGHMPAMSMEYRPRDSKLLDAVKSGDHIEFTLEDVAGIATITEMKRH